MNIGPRHFHNFPASFDTFVPPIAKLNLFRIGSNLPHPGKHSEIGKPQLKNGISRYGPTLGGVPSAIFNLLALP
jgi:hypothetical protein